MERLSEEELKRQTRGLEIPCNHPIYMMARELLAARRVVEAFRDSYQERRVPKPKTLDAYDALFQKEGE